MIKNLSSVLTVEDMRLLGKARVPRMFFDYCDGGSWTESTLRRNTSDFQKLLFRQRVARDISQRSTNCVLLGEQVKMPIALAPVGMTGMQYPDGEIHAAKAAVRAGIPYTLSTMSISPLEAVADAVEAPIWFQLYVMRDRQFVKNLIARAKAAQCSALVVTLDLQITGQRHADLRNKLAAPPKPSLSAAWQIMTRPLWCARMSRARHRTFGNIVGHVPGIDNLSRMAEWTAEQFDPTLDWEKIKWIRDLWQGPIILKGVLDAEDAQACVDLGADGFVVSNHGGRQMDGAPSTISKLREIVECVGGRTEVYIDSGIRSGQDVMRSLALGAKGVLIGRPYVYGLEAAGEKGVTRILDILRMELESTMAFCGVDSIEKIGAHNLENFLMNFE